MPDCKYPQARELAPKTMDGHGTMAMAQSKVGEQGSSIDLFYTHSNNNNNNKTFLGFSIELSYPPDKCNNSKNNNNASNNKNSSNNSSNNNKSNSSKVVGRLTPPRVFPRQPQLLLQPLYLFQTLPASLSPPIKPTHYTSPIALPAATPTAPRSLGRTNNNKQQQQPTKNTDTTTQHNNTKDYNQQLNNATIKEQQPQLNNTATNPINITTNNTTTNRGTQPHI
ncbi:probable WRKY transcription factor protein 1 [Macrobrachium nipponense]|uniref:probable WRKY transcription factor protein 1 n=1 Tax=Macrobrachium nipponense TaxID=159736 RepID=UPI0030C7F4FF